MSWVMVFEYEYENEYEHEYEYEMVLMYPRLTRRRKFVRSRRIVARGSSNKTA